MRVHARHRSYGTLAETCLIILQGCLLNEQILINVTPQESRVAIMEQGAVQELHMERVSNRGLVGNIYLGRVGRVLPGMQSAFIDIGLSRAAFLHVADLWSGNKHNDKNGDKNIDQRETVGIEGQLGGGEVLPGLALSLAELFTDEPV